MCLPVKGFTFYNEYALGDVGNFPWRNECFSEEHSLKSLVEICGTAFPVGVTDTEIWLLYKRFIFCQICSSSMTYYINK